MRDQPRSQGTPRGSPSGHLRHSEYAALGRPLEGLRRGLQPLHHDLQSLDAMEPTGRVGRIFYALTGSVASTHIKAHCSAAAAKKGGLPSDIGTSRGGRTTIIHALSDHPGRPDAWALTPGSNDRAYRGQNLTECMSCPSGTSGAVRHDTENAYIVLTADDLAASVTQWVDRVSPARLRRGGKQCATYGAFFPLNRS